MTEFLFSWAESIWLMLVDSAFLFMVGLVLAGLIWLFMDEKFVAKYIRDGGLRSVFNAAVIGIPLPLCSCSVLPVATQLRKGGASKGGVVSFLVATPESGADSILLTYSLTDPIMTVARPVVAFVAAMAAGTAEILLPSKNESKPVPELESCESGCDCETPIPTNKERQAWLGRLWKGVHYAFTDLLEDLAPYLLAGFVLAGLVGAFLDTSGITLSETVRHGWIGYAGAILIGLPMYICASASTPMAAVLLAAGFSPGAILVFLLVGPATNIASLVVVKRIIGFASTIRYLIAIVLTAILGGLATDYVYEFLQYTPNYDSAAHGDQAGWLALGSAMLLSLFILYFVSQATYKRLGSFLLNR